MQFRRTDAAAGGTLEAAQYEIELSELLSAFEEKFGVTAAAPVAVAAAGGAAAAAPVEDEKDETDGDPDPDQEDQAEESLKG